MTTPFSYSTTYVLDKSHFSETYDESKVDDETKHPYKTAIALALGGMALLYLTDISPYIAWFVVAWGGVEALSVRFQKPWWLARQMISKAANNQLTLTIDEQGIGSKSHYVDGKILWQNITKFEKTSRGWLLYQNTSKSYLSDRCLSDEAQQFIAEKSELRRCE